MRLPWRAYDPARYWSRRADPNVAEPDPARAEFDRDFIAGALGDAHNIFELGPGTGRTFAAYSPGQTVTTRDITNRHHAHLEGLAQQAGITLCQTLASDPLAPFEHGGRDFEVGISSQVFLHMPPEIFSHAITQMARICQRLIIIAGYHSTFPGTAGTHLPAHVFSHDYILALGDLGCRITDIRSRAEILYVTADT